MICVQMKPKFILKYGNYLTTDKQKREFDGYELTLLSWFCGDLMMLPCPYLASKVRLSFILQHATSVWYCGYQHLVLVIPTFGTAATSVWYWCYQLLGTGTTSVWHECYRHRMLLQFVRYTALVGRQ